MRSVSHSTDGPHKILHIESVGCDVNVIVGTHDPNGIPFTTVEILPHEPDDDGRRWFCLGSSSVLVMPVLSPSEVERDRAVSGPTVSGAPLETPIEEVSR